MSQCCNTYFSYNYYYLQLITSIKKNLDRKKLWISLKKYPKLHKKVDIDKVYSSCTEAIQKAEDWITMLKCLSWKEACHSKLNLPVG